MSGNAFVRWALPETVKNSRKVAKSVNCPDDQNILKCLQNVPARRLTWNQIEAFVSFLKH